MAAICFNLGTEAFGPYTCSISPAGTYNGKDYYIMVAPDCVTPYNAQIAPNVWTVWYSTGNGYVNQWVLSEGLDQYLYVAWYLPVSSSPDVPLGNWVLGPDSGVIDLVSTDTNCIATISITYTPQYEGCHRIYFRLDGNETYCLYTDTSLSEINVEKEVTIPITGDIETCLGVPDLSCVTQTVEGYIEPCCAGVNDETLRAPFSFNPTQVVCTAYTASCSGAGISRIIVTNPGSGYASTPSVSIFNSTGGSGFTYTLVMDGDTVQEVIVNNSGDGYPSTSTVFFLPSPTGDDPVAYIEFCPCGPSCGLDSKITVEECINQNDITVVTPFPGDPFVVCSTSTPVVSGAPKASVTPVGPLGSTCCQCKSYRVSNSESVNTLEISYIDCFNVYQEASIAPSAALVICAVIDSVALAQDYQVVITDLGTC